jgi:hypothetical protein
MYEQCIFTLAQWIISPHNVVSGRRRALHPRLIQRDKDFWRTILRLKKRQRKLRKQRRLKKSLRKKLSQKISDI